MDPYKEYIAQTSYAHSAVYYIHGLAVYICLSILHHHLPNTSGLGIPLISGKPNIW